MGLGYGDSFKEAYLLGAAKAQELLGESVGLIDALHECESDRILLKKELAAESEMSRKLAGALDFYSKPRFISRDKGKTWQELVQIIPNVFSEPMNPDIQREVMFGTVAKEAIAQYRAAREGKS